MGEAQKTNSRIGQDDTNRIDIVTHELLHGRPASNDAGAQIGTKKWRKLARSSKDKVTKETIELGKRKLEGEMAEDMDIDINGKRAKEGIQALQNLLRREDPDVVFLCETIKQVANLENLKRRCNMYGLVGVDAVGRSGGLAMMWKEDIDLKLMSYSKFHIDMEVTDNQHNVWRLIGFYGEPDPQKRHEGWTMLKTLAQTNDKRWVCIGDFNEILSNSKKEGGNLHPAWQMRDFWEALDHSNLHDLGYKGKWYTWQHGMTMNTLIRERLNRGVATYEWTNLFPDYAIFHLTSPRSDHCPILLHTDGSRLNNVKRR
ncbi:hypothetical protein PTKIN_Ptkin04bG0146800 [Pterospermum kingtungense]